MSSCHWQLSFGFLVFWDYEFWAVVSWLSPVFVVSLNIYFCERLPWLTDPLMSADSALFKELILRGSFLVIWWYCVVSHCLLVSVWSTSYILFHSFIYLHIICLIDYVLFRIAYLYGLPSKFFFSICYFTHTLINSPIPSFINHSFIDACIHSFVLSSMFLFINHPVIDTLIN